MFLRNAKLSKDFEEQWWAYLAATMKRNGHGSPIWMVPALMTARLSGLKKSEFARDILELSGVPLGMNDFGAVGRQGNALLAVLFDEHLKYVC